ncbi:UPF0236 family protein, partial [Geobacillus stearothermophilus]|nr:UPF0236 family protein [Geobacillus stearothermophilus]
MIPRRGLRTFVRDARRGHQAKRGRKKQMSYKKDSLPAMMVMTNIHKTRGRESMKHLTTEWPLLKELEEQLVRTLQKVFAVLLAALLEEIDQQLAEARDKRRS